MTAPERIWAYPSYVTGWDAAIAHNRAVLRSHEYVRADLYAELQAENEKLWGIICKVDEYSPVADETCDEPGITFTEAIMRKWPELRVHMK